MYAESAYWILSAIVTVTATLVGFVLVSAVFFVERFKGFYDKVSSVMFAFEGIPEEVLKIPDEDFDVIRDTAQSAFKGQFYRFFFTLMVSLVIGVATILLAITSLSGLPASSQVLTNDVNRIVATVEILFVFFMIITIAVVVTWVHAGFDMTVFKSKYYEDLEFMFQRFPLYKKRVKARTEPILAEAVKAKEAELGRRLSEVEQQQVFLSAIDETTELGRRWAEVMEEEKRRIVRVSAFESRKRKTPQGRRKKAA